MPAPERWQALVRLNHEPTRTSSIPIRGGADRGPTHSATTTTRSVREAATASPLHPMPLAVLAHSNPLRDPYTGQAGRRRWKAHQARRSKDLATLVPNARFTVAAESGHDIHQDQPELVIEAIRQVVEGVRNPDTWYDLTSCCAT